MMLLRPIAVAERGLRLLGPPRSLGLLQEAPIIAQHARRGVVRQLETIYYDTPDRALFASDLSLRVQRQGRRFIQTLRQHGSRQNGSPRLAWEVAVGAATPDLACLAGARILPLSAALFERLSASALKPVFATRLRRQLRRLELPRAQVEIAFDEGVIEAASRQESLAEIRLALQAGEASVLYEIGMRLLELAPLRVNTATTVRRGYALASGARPKAEKAAPSTLTRDFVVDDAIAAVLTACQAHLQVNQSVAEDGGSAEGVHQMRVALRRMRTAFSLLGRDLPSPTMQGLSREAKWLAGELGPARGWDVFLSDTLGAPGRLPAPGADFDGLRLAAEAPRQAGYAVMREAIGCTRTVRFEMQLSQWIARRGWRNEVDRDGLAILAEPAQAMAMRVLDRLHRKALKQGRRFKSLSAEQRHALRITLKKLRYATEFFLPLCAEPEAAGRFVARLSALQDALGRDHDAATTQPLLDEITLQPPRPGGGLAGLHQAIGVVIGWQAREALVAGTELSRRWRQFRTLAPFWTRSAPAL